MPKHITALEADPSRPGSMKVLVDGKPYCTVNESAVERLSIGAEWNDQEKAAAGSAADEEGAWRTLLRALERRSFSVGEIRRRLRQKGHPPAAVEYAVGRAEQMKLLDDALYAQNYVQTRAGRGRGPARLRQDLRIRGVSDQLIDSALREHWPEPEAALDMVANLAARRVRQFGSIPNEAKKRRLLAFLARRGFSGSRVAELVRRVISESEVPLNG